MKTHALSVNRTTHKTKIITAFDAIYLREFYQKEFLKYDFFYVDDFKDEKYSVLPKYIKSTNTAFFAFNSNNNHPQNIGDEGETLTHFAAKKALARMSHLKLVDIENHRELILNVTKEKNCNEKQFKFDRTFYADVYYKLDKNNQLKDMRKYLYKWYENFVIEVCVSHKVPFNKCDYFFKNNIPIFEVFIPKNTCRKFGLEKPVSLSKEKINTAIINMQRMFEKGIRGKFISDPSSEEYLTMCKYKKEIERFKQETLKTKNEYQEISSKLQNANEELENIEQKIGYYKSLELHNEELKNEIAEFKKHPLKFIFLNRKHK
ncbi:MAG: hypothetical protein IJV39_06355 [Ruminococcus sp.]|nr:hypothetical protein [Ruminococcus sp.]